MSCFADNEPIVVDRAEGRELIDVDGRRYLDAISSLWVTTLGHAVQELDDAVRDQLGLKLVKTADVPVDVIVVDRVDRAPA